MERRAVCLLFILCFLALSCFSPPEESGFHALVGRVTLENSSDHSDVEIFFADFGFSLLTDPDGTFYLPSEMYEGTWQIVAKFPYYLEARGTLDVFEGGLEEPVDLTLTQAVSLDVVADRFYYFPPDVIDVVVTMTNLTSEPVSLESDTAPLFAVCLAQNSKPVYGGLYKGDKPVHSSIEFGPYETKSVELFWEIPEDVAPGVYQLYCAPVDALNHPAYFDPRMTRLQRSLLRKLPYAVIEVLLRR